MAEKLSEKADKGIKKLGKDTNEGLKKIGKDIDKGVKKITEETDKGIKKLRKQNTRPFVTSYITLLCAIQVVQVKAILVIILL